MLGEDLVDIRVVENREFVVEEVDSSLLEGVLLGCRAVEVEFKKEEVQLGSTTRPLSTVLLGAPDVLYFIYQHCQGFIVFLNSL